MHNIHQLARLVLVVALSGGLLVWAHQHSLTAFWQQRYHQPPPWSALQGQPLWDAGSRFHSALAKASLSFWEELAGPALAPAPAPAPASTLAAGPPAEATPVEPTAFTAPPAPAPLQAAPAQSAAGPIAKQHARLQPGQRVLLAGDSMMQGIAPHLASRLRKSHGVHSLDLSRQSTGLAYPSFFNWSKAIAGALAKHPDIRLLVMFLGPNDPWDMPATQPGPYLRFASPPWEALYRSRIRDILDQARTHGADIIWVSPPNMRRSELSRKVAYLSELYESEVLQAGEIFLSGNAVLNYLDGGYSDALGSGSQLRRVRSGDGIHFTLAGQRLFADALFDLVRIEP